MIPGSPPFTIFIRLMDPPNVNPTKGTIKPTRGAKNLLQSSSRLPRIMPTTRGTSTATSDIRGMFARPEAPKATRVRKGPSLKVSILTAAQSVLSP